MVALEYQAIGEAEPAELAARKVLSLATNLDPRGNVWRIVQIEGSAEDIANAVTALKGDEQNRLVEKRILGQQPRRLTLWYKFRPRDRPGRPSLTRLAFDTLGRETFITDRSAHNGLEVRILTRQGPRLRRFLQLLEETASRDFEFTLLRVGPPRMLASPILTQEDENALRVAREMGFFRVPRPVGLREIAQRLGCSLSTASARLRRAQDKLLKSYLGE